MKVNYEKALKTMERAEQISETTKEPAIPIALAYAIHSEQIKYALRLAIAVEDYDEETFEIPLGQEDKQRGASVYNWRKYVISALRKMAQKGGE